MFFLCYFFFIFFFYLFVRKSLVFCFSLNFFFLVFPCAELEERETERESRTVSFGCGNRMQGEEQAGRPCIQCSEDAYSL